jgi:hypothetical protein
VSPTNSSRTTRGRTLTLWRGGHAKDLLFLVRLPRWPPWPSDIVLHADMHLASAPLMARVSETQQAASQHKSPISDLKVHTVFLHKFSSFFWVASRRFNQLGGAGGDASVTAPAFL